MSMTHHAVTADPSELGFDPARLQRIGDHFRHYVDDGRLAGWSFSISRRGEVAHTDSYGQRNIETGAPIEDDTIYRFYSMTKPVTSVAVMMLFEEGLLSLDDPVAKYIPAFAEQRVYTSGSAASPNTEGLRQPMLIWHLLTHMSGLTYGFMHAHPVDAIYRTLGYEWGQPKGYDLEQAVNDWASAPLLFQPGTEWNYSVATDVLGRIVEVVSGMSLPEFFQSRIFEPLKMHDTGFWADTDDKLARLAALYARNPSDGSLLDIGAMGRAAEVKPTMHSGGGGLVSSMHDYHRFTQMLLQRGELEGARLLGSRTVDYMATNHLPGDVDLSAVARPLFSETEYDGVGFGLGFSVVIDSAAAKSLCSVGEYAWGGAASTAFWVDPAEELTAIFLTQLLPSSTYPLRPEFRRLVYQALVD